MIHFGLYQFAGAMAGGFAGAYLLRKGFSVPETLCIFACLLLLRFMMRLLSLGIVRRIGPRGAMALGVAIASTQYLPLLWADQTAGLLCWIAVVSVAEAIYWPTYHACVAVIGGGASRGREVGFRSAVLSIVGVFGPLCGGFLLQHLGPRVDFGIAALLGVSAAAPALLLPKIDVGPIPSIRDWSRDINLTGVKAFASDGWLSSGIALAWPLVLYVSLGAGWEAFGIAGAIAGLAGAVAGMWSGGAIDRGDRERWLTVVSWALAGSLLLRLVSPWSPIMAEVANATGAVVISLYLPVLMTGVYECAKSTGTAYKFHFAAEAGWDLGAASGCLAAALAVWATGAISASMLPCALAIYTFRLCVKGHAAHGTKADYPLARPQSGWTDAPPV